MKWMITILLWSACGISVSSAQEGLDTVSVYVKGLEVQSQQLKDRIREQDKMIKELTASNQVLYSSLADQLEIQKKSGGEEEKELTTDAETQALNQKIVDQEKVIQELTASSAVLQKKLEDQAQIIELLTVDNTNLREEVTMLLTQETAESPAAETGSRDLPAQVSTPPPPVHQPHTTEAPPVTYTVQFFKSRYSDKTFPELQGLGQMISFQVDGLTSYQLIIDDRAKLSSVRQAGFADAYIIKE